MLIRTGFVARKMSQASKGGRKITGARPCTRRIPEPWDSNPRALGFQSQSLGIGIPELWDTVKQGLKTRYPRALGYGYPRTLGYQSQSSGIPIPGLWDTVKQGLKTRYPRALGYQSQGSGIPIPGLWDTNPRALGYGYPRTLGYGETTAKSTVSLSPGITVSQSLGIPIPNQFSRPTEQY